MECINNELLYVSIEQAGFNYSELAEKMEISRGTIYNVVFGHTPPSHFFIQRLSRILRLSQEEFIAIFYPTMKFTQEG